MGSAAVILISYLQDSIENQEVGSMVKFHCDAGYMMIGHPLSTCGVTGKWSTPTPRCIKACTYPGGLIGGQITGEVKVHKGNYEASCVPVAASIFHKDSEYLYLWQSSQAGQRTMRLLLS